MYDINELKTCQEQNSDNNNHNNIRIVENDEYSPSSGPQTRGIISRMALQDGSSKHNCRANRQLRIATAVLTFGPATI